MSRVVESTLVSYALSKQVPCIEREAVFQTNYGELTLTSRESAQVGALVRKLLDKRLKNLQPKKIIPRENNNGT